VPCAPIRETFWILRLPRVYFYDLQAWSANCISYYGFNRILDFSNGLDFYPGFFLSRRLQKFPSFYY